MLHERKSTLVEGRAVMSSPESDLAPMRGRAARVGADLRAARLQYGWDLEAVAASLRIRPAYLQAIEAGRVADLPGNAYALGFLRTYAAALGLDADEMCRRFRTEVAELNTKTELTFPAPVPERGVPAGAVIVLGVALAVGAYVGWYHFAERAPAGHTTIPVPPELARLAEPTALAPKAIGTATLPPKSVEGAGATTEMPGSSGVNPPGPAGGAGSSAASFASLPAAPPTAASVSAQGLAASSGDTIASAPSSATAAAPEPGSHAGTRALAASSPAPGMSPSGQGASAAASANNPGAASTPVRAATSVAPSAAARAGSPLAAVSVLAPPAQAAPMASGRIVVRVTAESWIEVKDANGTVIFTKLMQPGETWTAPQEPGLTLTTGNAGGTQLVVDGKVSEPLGAPGQVERNQPLDAGLIKAGALPAQIAAAVAPGGDHPNPRTTP
ncbi:MAG: RodZ domain-containing protein [Acetobacteraceae bacterium]